MYSIIVILSIDGSVIAPTLNAEQFIVRVEAIREVAMGQFELIVTGGEGRATT